MKRILQASFVVLIFLTLSNCASIFSKSTYPFRIVSEPTAANVSIKNGKGIEIFKGSTPATVRLKAGAGFFKRAEYTAYVTMAGYDEQILPINFSLDGWYFGNILVGGVIGMLIIDPATGAMYKLDDEFISVNLTKNTSGIENPAFKVYDLVNLPKEYLDHLVRVKTP